MRWLALLWLLIGGPAFAQSGGTVLQSGRVTAGNPGHSTCWTTNGVVMDCGGYAAALCAPLPANFSAICATITTSPTGCMSIVSGSCTPSQTHYLVLQQGGHLLLQGGGSLLLQSQ